jgi:outer membrane protein assembly factor BamD (BamD/ComL family)
MSIIGILSSNLFAAGAAPNTQSSQNNPSKFQQIKTEFQQLGQDLQSGNLEQAQQDFTTLSQNLPGASQSTAASANAVAAGATTGNNSVAQAFTQLGQDLKSGNLQAAQKDFTNLQQDVQQNSSQRIGGHHHHHPHAETSQSSSSSSSSQQSNAIAQAFGTLAQDLQAGNLSGSRSAFATLKNDLQQIGGFLTGGSTGNSSTVVPASTGSLNVTA